jgi:hypothetical protein
MDTSRVMLISLHRVAPQAALPVPRDVQYEALIHDLNFPVHRFVGFLELLVLKPHLTQ